MTHDQHLLERRQAILAAAQDVFDVRGYESATMDEIAEKADISKGNLYNHFQNKLDLFTKVFIEALMGDETEVEQLVAGPLTASEKLPRLMDYIFTQLQSYTRSGRLVMEIWATAARQQRQEELAENLGQIHSCWRKRFETILVQGIKAGEFGQHIEPPVAASLIWATVNGIIVQSMFDVEAETGERALATLKRSLLAGLTAWSAGKPRD